MTTLARPRAIAAFVGGCALLLVACAAPVRDARGLAIASGKPVAPRAPVTFQTDLGVQPFAPGSLPFSARLYGETRPETLTDRAGFDRYRLDIIGFPSGIVASWLWSEERWTLVRNDRREVMSGEGYALSAEDFPLRIPDVRILLGVLAGELLPGYPGIGTPKADGGGVVRWRYENETWEALIDPNNGLCRESRSPSLTLRYARHQARGGIVIPERIEVASGVGDTLLMLDVRDWNGAPEWKKNPFELVIPGSYERK